MLSHTSLFITSFASSLLLCSALPLIPILPRSSDFKPTTGYIQVTNQTDGTTAYLPGKLSNTGIFSTQLTTNTSDAFGIFYTKVSKDITSYIQDLLGFINGSFVDGDNGFLCGVQCFGNTNLTSDGTVIDPSDLVTGSNK